MAVYRVDLLIADPGPVFQWIEDNVPKGFVVRKIAYHTLKGWYMKVVFKRQSDAELFHRQWYPDETDHTVRVF